MAAQRSGSFGVNQCVSNTIAGISAATGQDLASVHESSWAVFDVTAERKIKVTGKRENIPAHNEQKIVNKEQHHLHVKMQEGLYQNKLKI